MMLSVGAPQQHKQPSRKGKKAWRKNVDVTDLQDGLEVYQEEVRTGGPLREKKSEDLFALDTTGSKEINKKYDLGKVLRVDQILSQRSAVPSVENRKRAGQEVASGIYEPASKRRKGDWVSKKDVQQLKRTINATSHLQKHGEGEEDPSSDLWSSIAGPEKHENLEYVPKQRAKVAPKSITQAPVAITANGKPVRAIRPPEAGTSYNPDFDEWNELVVKEGDKELAAEQARIEAARKEAEKEARIAAIADDENGAKTDDESAWEGFETDHEDVAGLRKKRPSRKTPVERNKAKRRKEVERQAKHERKMAEKQIVTLGLIKQDNEDTSLADRGPDQAVNSDGDQGHDGDDRKLRRRKMGNMRLPEKNLEVVLPEELRDSLRLLKPEGNLLQDRFRNLLVNGRIESRKPVLQAKKKRVKYTEKWSFKDFSIPT